MMSAISVLLFLLVWTFTAVADSFSITCDNVTGQVGKELPLTCRVSYQSDTCCMTKYMFKNMDKDTEIYTEEFNKDPCLLNTSITHPYTANKVMNTTFMFFLQTECGPKTTELNRITVNVTENTEDGHMNETAAQSVLQHVGPTKETDNKLEQNNTVVAVTIPVAICFTIIILAFILLWKHNFNFTTCGFQRGYNMGVCANNNKHTDDETTTSEQQNNIDV